MLFIYQLDSIATANSEILAVNSHKFLIDERNGSTGAAGIKLLYMVGIISIGRRHPRI